jgi:ribonuclease III
VSEASHGLHWVHSRLGYVPRDAALFELALTHRSAANRNYERLEFLGDAVLNLLVADYLYQRFPQADEGAMSRLRASLVSGASLARIAASLQLGDAVALGAGELKSGGFRRESILADALEAVCGAVYLDAGLEVTRKILLQVLGATLAALDEPAGAKDAKTQLQEWLQARGRPLPRYHVEGVHGESHAQTFRVSCQIDSPAEHAIGEGSSRRRAEQMAAQAVLERIVAGQEAD